MKKSMDSNRYQKKIGLREVLNRMKEEKKIIRTKCIYCVVKNWWLFSNFSYTCLYRDFYIVLMNFLHTFYWNVFHGGYSGDWNVKLVRRSNNTVLKIILKKIAILAILLETQFFILFLKLFLYYSFFLP